MSKNVAAIEGKMETKAGSQRRTKQRRESLAWFSQGSAN